MTRDPRNAFDFPHLADDVFVAWHSNGKKWPDARRELAYLSQTKRNCLTDSALFTIHSDEAATFPTMEAAQEFVRIHQEKHPGPYNVRITDVATLKAACGYTR